jgi:hypothetical protein
MTQDQVIFICPTCFRVCESETECHAHLMMLCETGQPGDDKRKPVMDRFGRYASRAPLWYLQALQRARKTQSS